MNEYIKKEIALVIPTAILQISSKELSHNDKLVFGLHYAYFKKEGATYLTQKEIGKQLGLHENIIVGNHKRLKNKQLLVEEGGVHKVVEQTVGELQKDIIGAQQIILPYLLYSRKINSGAKLLWGEYNRFKNKKEGHFVKRVTTANNIGSSIASVTNWSNELEEAKLITSKTSFRGLIKQKNVHTVDLNKIEFPKKPEEESLKPLEVEKVKTNSVDKERIEYLKGVRKKSNT